MATAAAPKHAKAFLITPYTIENLRCKKHHKKPKCPIHNPPCQRHHPSAACPVHPPPIPQFRWVSDDDEEIEAAAKASRDSSTVTCMAPSGPKSKNRNNKGTGKSSNRNNQNESGVLTDSTGASRTLTPASTRVLTPINTPYSVEPTELLYSASSGLPGSDKRLMKLRRRDQIRRDNGTFETNGEIPGLEPMNVNSYEPGDKINHLNYAVHMHHSGADSYDGLDANVNATCQCADENTMIAANWTTDIGPPAVDPRDPEPVDCGESPWCWYVDAIWGCENYKFDLCEDRRAFTRHVDGLADGMKTLEPVPVIQACIIQRQGGDDCDEPRNISLRKITGNFKLKWSHPRKHQMYIVVIYPPLGVKNTKAKMNAGCGPCAADPECLCSEAPIWRRMFGGNRNYALFPGFIFGPGQQYVIEVVSFDLKHYRSNGSSLVVIETFLAPDP